MGVTRRLVPVSTRPSGKTSRVFAAVDELGIEHPVNRATQTTRVEVKGFMAMRITVFSKAVFFSDCALWILMHWDGARRLPSLSGLA